MISEQVKKEFMGFRFIEAYVASASVSHSVNFDARLFDASEGSFSRFSWDVSEKIALVKDDSEVEDDGVDRHLTRFYFRTYVSIAKGDVEEYQDKDIPDELLLGEIEVLFAAEYLSPIPHTEADGLSVRLLEDIRVPADAWPYWRETLQGLALRARLPLPTLSPFRPPSVDSVRVAYEADEARKSKSKKRSPRKKLSAPAKAANA